MSEQVLDVKGSVRLVRRRWRTVAVLALAGAAAGAGYEVAHPPGYQATALVLLPASQGGSSSGTSSSSAPTKNDITTDARIAVSAAVLGPAGRRADPSASLASLQHRVATSAAATGVLDITAGGSTAAQAEGLANAVAAELVRFVTTNGSGSSTEIVAGLQAQATQLDAQLGDVQQEITAANQRLAADGAGSTSGQSEAALVGQLTSEESTLTLQLDSVKSQIAQAKLGEVSANQGTRVIQRAAAASRPSPVRQLVAPLAGLAAGVVLGALVVLAIARRDRRLWTRDELAEAVGCPVLLSLSVPGGGRAARDWTTLLSQYEPGSSEQWNVRRALRELGVGESGGRSELTAYTLAGDRAALAQVVRVAVAAAGAGLRTLLAVTGQDDPAAELGAACTRFRSDGREPRTGLRVRSGMPQKDDRPVDLVVVAAVVDPDGPKVPGPRRPPGAEAATAVTVLSVSAGRASAEQLARVALAAADGGGPVAALLVANPAAGDQTVGRLPGHGSSTSVVVRRRSPAQKAAVRGR